MATITRSKNGQSDHYSTDNHLAGTFEVTDLTDDLGDTDSPAPFTVAADGWNNWKNVFFLGDDSSIAAKMTDFVHVDIDDSDNDQGRTFDVENAKRGNILLGEGGDTLNLSLATNGDGWSNTFYIDTAAGDDTVKITEGVAQTNAKITDGRFTTTDVTLGDGDDTFTNETKSDDTITTGEGSDTVNYDPSMGGADVITDFDIDSSSDTDTEGDSDTLSFSFGGVDYALNTAQQFADFIVEIEKDRDGDTDAIQDGHDLILDFGNGNKVRLEGVIPMIAIDTGPSNNWTLIDDTTVAAGTFFWGDVIDGEGSAPTSPAPASFVSAPPAPVFTSGNDTVDGSINPFTETDALAGDDDVTLPDGFTDAFTGNDGNDRIIGSADANNISGGAGNDHIDGGDGDDLLRGDIQGGGASTGDGDDTINGGAGDDIIGGQGGNDDIDGGSGNDRLFGSKGDDMVKGGDGDDEVNGNQGNDVVSGGNGNDTLDGGAGNDTLDGGAGNDTAHGGEGDDTVLGGDGDDLLRGDLEGGGANHGDGDDIIKGGAGDDIIGGQGGNDDIDGGIGDDRLFGSDGNDTIDGGEGNDFIRGNLDDDTLDGGDGDDTIEGGKGNDRLIGDSGSDELIGGEGDDFLKPGFGGGEIVDGGAGDDHIQIEGAVASIDGGDGYDWLEGRFSRVELNIDVAASNLERVWGSDDRFVSGGDVLDGSGVGADTDLVIRGIGNDDEIMGGAGDDDIRGDGGKDTVSGGDGDDKIDGNFGSDDLSGDAGDDDILGGNGNDALKGGDGADRLRGQDGDDVLTGGDGTVGPDLVLNGGFEIGGQVGERGNIENWAEAGNNKGESFKEGIYLSSQATDDNNILAESVRDDDRPAHLKQTLSDLEAGDTLQLSFRVADRNRDDTGDGWTVKFNGAEVLTVTDTDDLGGRGVFSSFTAQVTSQAGDNVLEFVGIEAESDGEGVLLDDVALQRIGDGDADTFDFRVRNGTDIGDDVITDFEIGLDEVVLAKNNKLDLGDLTIANDANGDAVVTFDSATSDVNIDGSITFAGLDAQTILDNQNDIFVI